MARQVCAGPAKRFQDVDKQLHPAVRVSLFRMSTLQLPEFPKCLKEPGAVMIFVRFTGQIEKISHPAPGGESFANNAFQLNAC